MTDEANVSTGAEPATTENMIPQHRLDEIAAQKREAEAKTAELSKKLEEIEAKQLADDGKINELYAAEKDKRRIAESELAIFKSKSDEIESYEKAEKESILSEWSDEDKADFGEKSLKELRTLNNRLYLNKTTITKPAPKQGALGAFDPKFDPRTMTAEEQMANHDKVLEWYRAKGN